MGNAGDKVDTQPPTVHGQMSGTLGENGWFVSAVGVTATAEDLTSGVASHGVSLNGTSFSPSLTVTADGTYTVYARATDNAGNAATVTAPLSVDATPPAVTLNPVGGTLGANGWYVSNATVGASAADSAPGSGLASLVYSLDGGAQTAYSGPLTLTHGSHTVVFTATDRGGNSASRTQTVNVDTRAPTVTLNPVGGTLGSNGWYVSSATVGASAADPAPNSVLSSLVYSLDGGAQTAYSGPLTLTHGSHTVVFTARDQAGNSASRTQNVNVDTRVPAVTLNPVGGTLGANGWYVTSATVGASAADPAPNSGLASFVYSLDGGAQTAYSTPLTIGNGSHTAVFTARDQAGNGASRTQNVRVDTAVPTLAPSITMGTLSNGWYVSEVRVDSHAADATSGLGSVEYSLNGGSTWNAGGVVDLDADGTYAVSFRAADRAGNTAGAAPVAFKLDATPPDLAPVITGTAGLNGWYVSTVQVTAGAGDAGSGLESVAYSLDGGGTWTAGDSFNLSADGVRTFSFRAADRAGNLSDTAPDAIGIDTAAPHFVPAVTAGTLGSGGWYVSAVRVTAGADDTGSGLNAESVRYSLDGGVTWHAGDTVDLSSDGAYSVTFQAADQAGNTATSSATAIGLDATAPDLSPVITGTNGLNGWYVSSVQVSAGANDTDSGLDALSVQYSLDGGVTWNAGDAFDLGADGVYTFSFRAADRAGNSSDTAPAAIGIDTAAPYFVPAVTSGTPGSGGWYVSAVRVTAGADDTGSGLDASSVEYSLDGGVTWHAGETVDLPADGAYSVTFHAADQAGNTADSAPFGAGVDTTDPAFAPYITGTLGLNGWYVSAVRMNAGASDAGSGVYSVEHSLDGGGTWYLGGAVDLSADGAYTAIFRAADTAGNWAPSALTSARVDATPPQSTFLSPAQGSAAVAAGSISLSGNVTDGGAGVAGAELTLDGGANWRALTLDSGGDWAYAWDVNAVPNGAYEARVRTTDLAGNAEQGAYATLTVDNGAPGVSITNRFLIGQSAAIRITPAMAPVSGARITVGDLFGRWPARAIDFSAGSLPSAFQWDGRFGDGTVAPIGAYTVAVEAWDAYGHTGRATGLVIIPLPVNPTPLPSATPTFAPLASRTPMPTATPILTNTPRPTSTSALPILPSRTLSPTRLFSLTSTGASTPRPTSTSALPIQPSRTPLPSRTRLPSLTATSSPTARPTATATSQPSATRTPLPSPTNTRTFTPSATATAYPFYTPSATRPYAVVSFGDTPQMQSMGAAVASGTPPLSNILWGAQAAAVAGVVTAYVLAERRKRDEEAQREADERARAALELRAEQEKAAEQEAQEEMAKVSGIGLANVVLNPVKTAIAAVTKASQATLAAMKTAIQPDNQTFQAKLREAQGKGLPPMQVNDYLVLTQTKGYASAIGTLDAYIAQAKRDNTITAAFQDTMRKKEADAVPIEVRLRAEAVEEAWNQSKSYINLEDLKLTPVPLNWKSSQETMCKAKPNASQLSGMTSQWWLEKSIIQSLNNSIVQPLKGLLEYAPFSNVPAHSFQNVDFGKYHQTQTITAEDARLHCGDFSISMVCNIYNDSLNKPNDNCSVAEITKLINSMSLGRIWDPISLLQGQPKDVGGSTPFGINKALNILEIPYTFDSLGSIKKLEDALKEGKIIIVSEGSFTPIWGHVFVIVGEETNNFLVLNPSEQQGAGVTKMNKEVLLRNWWYPFFRPYWIIGK